MKYEWILNTLENLFNKVPFKHLNLFLRAYLASIHIPLVIKLNI